MYGLQTSFHLSFAEGISHGGLLVCQPYVVVELLDCLIRTLVVRKEGPHSCFYPGDQFFLIFCLFSHGDLLRVRLVVPTEETFDPSTPVLSCDFHPSSSPVDFISVPISHECGEDHEWGNAGCTSLCHKLRPHDS